MERKQLQVKNDVEALIVEQALLLARELKRTGQEAPSGQVLDRMEGVILDQGRELLRVALEASLQGEAATVEKKGCRPARVPAGGNIATKDIANGPS